MILYFHFFFSENKKGKGKPCDFESHLDNKGCEKGLICNERPEGPGICWDDTPLGNVILEPSCVVMDILYHTANFKQGFFKYYPKTV